LLASDVTFGTDGDEFGMRSLGDSFGLFDGMAIATMIDNNGFSHGESPVGVGF
jgi:hypothetical protein